MKSKIYFLLAIFSICISSAKANENTINYFCLNDTTIYCWKNDVSNLFKLQISDTTLLNKEQVCQYFNLSHATKDTAIWNNIIKSPNFKKVSIDKYFLSISNSQNLYQCTWILSHLDNSNATFTVKNKIEKFSVDPIVHALYGKNITDNSQEYKQVVEQLFGYNQANMDFGIIRTNIRDVLNQPNKDFSLLKFSDNTKKQKIVLIEHFDNTAPIISKFNSLVLPKIFKTTTEEQEKLQSNGYELLWLVIIAIGSIILTLLVLFLLRNIIKRKWVKDALIKDIEKIIESIAHEISQEPLINMKDDYTKKGVFHFIGKYTQPIVEKNKNIKELLEFIKEHKNEGDIRYSELLTELGNNIKKVTKPTEELPSDTKQLEKLIIDYVSNISDNANKRAIEILEKVQKGLIDIPQEKLNENAPKNKKLDNLIEEIKSSISSLKRKYGEMETTNNELNNEITAKQNEIDNLKNNLSENKKKTGKLEKYHDQIEQNLNSFFLLENQLTKYCMEKLDWNDKDNYSNYIITTLLLLKSQLSMLRCMFESYENTDRFANNIREITQNEESISGILQNIENNKLSKELIITLNNSNYNPKTYKNLYAKVQYHFNKNTGKFPDPFFFGQNSDDMIGTKK